VLARRARQAAEVWPLRVLEPRARRGLRAGAQATSAERPGAGRWQLGAQGDGGGGDEPAAQEELGDRRR